MARLAATLENFTESNDRYARKLVLLTWSLIALTVLLIVLAFLTIEDARDSASLQNNIALNGQLYSARNIDVIDAIEHDTPIFKKDSAKETPHAGNFTTTDIDMYLGAFDVIKTAYDRHLLREKDLCISFSYYVEITNKNQEIRDYIKEQQKDDSGFFKAFDDLVRITAKSRDPDCSTKHR